MQMNSTRQDAQGKVALVTGASRRIGAAIMRALHGAGMSLCLHYRSSGEEAQRFADELNAARRNSVKPICADLLEPGAPDALVGTCVKHFGRLDLLVNNASAFYPTPIGSITQQDWDILLASNLKAPLFLSQAAAQPLSVHQGSIINITDIHAQRPLKNHIVYSIAKSGLLALTRSLAYELAPAIRVNGVAPGAILWSENADNDAARADILNRIPLKRCGRPEDIAAAVLFLFRDAGYVSGHILPVDGGRLLNI